MQRKGNNFGEQSPGMDRLFKEAMRYQAEAEKKELRDDAWRKAGFLGRARIAMASGFEVVSFVGGKLTSLAIDMIVVPIGAYLAYSLAHITSDGALPDPGRLSTWVGIYIVWRLIAFEVLCQYQKFHK